MSPEQKVKAIVDRIRASTGQMLLVGIPEEKNERTDESAQNAMIGYVMEFGSPEQNIPARPFLIPGCEEVRESVIDELRGVMDDGKMAHFQKAGMIARDSVVMTMTTSEYPPLAPSTIANRFRQRKTKSTRQAEKNYLDYLDAGHTPAESQNMAGIRPLINTGQLRRSITYVVRDA